MNKQPMITINIRRNVPAGRYCKTKTQIKRPTCLYVNNGVCAVFSDTLQVDQVGTKKCPECWSLTREAEK